jgi:hypothetical protein
MRAESQLNEPIEWGSFSLNEDLFTMIDGKGMILRILL